MKLIKYNTYDEQGFVKETNLTTDTFSGVNTKLASNYYLINTLHKLSLNTRASEILLSDGVPEQTQVFKIIEQENLISERSLVVNTSKMAYQDEDIAKKLNLIGDVPEPLSKSFLGLELLVLKKLKQEHGDSIQLSPYAQRLSSLVNSFYNKDIVEIEINDNFIKSILLEQSNRYDNIKELTTEIQRDSTRTDRVFKNLTKHSLNIENLKDNIKDNEAKIKSRTDDMVVEDAKKVASLKNKFTKFDHSKVKFFEFFGVSGIEDAILLEKEKKFPQISSVFKENQEHSQGIVEHLENENKKYKSQIAEIRESIEKDKAEKDYLLNYIKERKLEKEELTKNLFVKELDNDLDGLSIRNVANISKDNLMFIHVVPHFQPLENSPLKIEVSPMERLLAIRAFNPSLSTSTFKLDGTPFENTTFGNGALGVVLSKGLVGTIKASDAGTIVDSNGLRDQGSTYDVFSEELKRAKSRKNQGNSYNEATVSHSVPYANIILLDGLFAKKAESYHIDKSLSISNQVLKQLYEKIEMTNKIGSDHGMNSLPTIVMINGKMLEISNPKSQWNDNVKNDVKLTMEETEKLVRNSFQVKEIKSVEEIGNKEDFISNDARESFAKNMYSKYKNNMVSVLESKLRNTHGIGLKI